VNQPPDDLIAAIVKYRTAGVPYATIANALTNTGRWGNVSKTRTREIWERNKGGGE